MVLFQYFSKAYLLISDFAF